MRSEPARAKALGWAGFDVASRANNHAGDFGPAAMLSTSKYVREAGLVEAGVGASLAEAREAKFLESPRARVALVSAASSFPAHSRAGNSRGNVPAGLNPLRFTTITTVTPERLAELGRIAAEGTGTPRPSSTTLTFFGRTFTAADRPGVRTEPDAQDVTAIGKVVTSSVGSIEIGDPASQQEPR